MTTSAWSLDPLLSLKVGEAEDKLQQIEKSLTSAEASINLELLNELQVQGLFVKNAASECIELNEQSINKSADDLELLGAQMVTEETEVTKKREELNQSMLGSAQQLASCRLMLLRANELVDVALMFSNR